jgi:hypothetical protein
MPKFSSSDLCTGCIRQHNPIHFIKDGAAEQALAPS